MVAAFNVSSTVSRVPSGGQHVSVSVTGEGHSRESRKELSGELRGRQPSTVAYADSVSPESRNGILPFAETIAGPLAVASPSQQKRYSRKATPDSPNICFQCERTESKLWRRGPDGRLMCNACGLRWRRKIKATAALESAPRKRKLPAARSSSPEGPGPMALPQSSMMAAQKHGFLKGSFMSRTNGPMSIPVHSFGSLRYESSQVYLQQQERLEHECPNGLKKTETAVPPVDLSVSTSVDTTRTPVKASLDQVSGTMSTASQHSPVLSASPATEATNAHSMFVTHDQIDLAKSAEVLRRSVAQDLAVPDRIQTVTKNDATFGHSLQSTFSGSMSQEQSRIHLEEDSQEDFSQLLSLKAFVDDGGRHY